MAKQQWRMSKWAKVNGPKCLDTRTSLYTLFEWITLESYRWDPTMTPHRRLHKWQSQQTLQSLSSALQSRSLIQALPLNAHMSIPEWYQGWWWWSRNTSQGYTCMTTTLHDMGTLVTHHSWRSQGHIWNQQNWLETTGTDLRKPTELEKLDT